MKIKRYQFNSLPFVTIVDKFDCPIDPYVSCYLVGSLSSKSPYTRTRYANELLFVVQYFSSKGIDLPTRVASGRLISQREYMQFYDRCCLNKAAAGEHHLNAGFLNVSDKHIRNIIAANQRGLAKVASETLQGRVRRLREFLMWLFERFHELHAVDEVTRKNFVGLISKIKLDEDSLGRNRARTVGPNFSGMPDDILLRLMEMVQPSSALNPFKASKIRNYLIVSILVQTGIRRGALAKLKVSDCQFFGTFDKISIYRTGNDPTDPRAEKPNQKTKAHLAAIDPALMVQIKFYVDHVRTVFPRAQTHDFVFISENDSKGTAGQPLSLKAINAIFSKLSGELGFHLHPHTLRHKWNEIFDREGERRQVPSDLLEDARKYAMGWSQNTRMTRVYNENRLAMKTMELSKAHQKIVDQRK